MLVWLRAIYMMMQGKRGISALELQRQLKMKSYGTAWTILHKIREALKQRDERYKLKDLVELDGGSFGKRETGNQTEVLVAIETKDWIDEKGRQKSKAGFAKIVIADETKDNAQAFVDKAIVPGKMVNTDASPSLIDLNGVDVVKNGREMGGVTAAPLPVTMGSPVPTEQPTSVPSPRPKK